MARRLSLDEAVDLFLDHLKVERGLARHTLDGYGRDLARFAGFLAERGRADVDDITPVDVTDHLIALAEQGLAARSRGPRARRDPRAVQAPRRRALARGRSGRADRRAAHSRAGCRACSARTRSHG